MRETANSLKVTNVTPFFVVRHSDLNSVASRRLARSREAKPKLCGDSRRETAIFLTVHRFLCDHNYSLAICKTERNGKILFTYGL